MSDRYVHLFPFSGWDHRNENLVALGRYLVLNAAGIEARGGLAFGHEDMSGLRPLPEAVVKDMGVALPPLAYGPHAGIAPEPGEDWPAYCQRVFGIHDHKPFMVWLHSPMWRRTEPSAIGAALRIAYVLDYGVPYDHVEIAMGQAHTDYDMNGFLWEKLDLAPPPDFRRRRDWPAWIGAVRKSEMRAAIALDAGNFRQTLIANRIARPAEIEGCDGKEIAALEARLGPMPQSYRDFLAIAGRRAGRLVDRKEFWIYADQLETLDRRARERIFAWGEDADDPVPEDAIFIDARYGEHPGFILSGNRDDSLVFRFNADTGRVTQVGISVWAWAEGFVRDMRPNVRIAGGAQAPGDAAPPANQFVGSRAAWFVAYTLLAGGVLLMGWLVYTVLVLIV